MGHLDLNKELNYSDYKNLISRSIDLTLPFNGAVSFGPFSGTEIGVEKSLLARRTTTRFSSNIHTLTHLDLPWALSDEMWNELEKDDIPKPESLDTDYIYNLLKDYRAIRVHKCLVLDVSYKNQGLLELCRQSTLRVKEIDTEFKNLKWKGLRIKSDSEGEDYLKNTEVLDPRMPLERFEQLIDSLGIEIGEIKKEVEKFLSHLDQSEREEGVFIFFKTGWDIFKPPHRDLRHPIWNCWHPYLLHPYLYADTLDMLLRSDILGIGCDTPGVDCPIYDVSDNYAIPVVSETKKTIFNERAEDEKNKQWLPFKHVHAKLLSAYRFYIKNLYFPIITKSPIGIEKSLQFFGESAKVKAQKGWVTIIPISVDETKVDSILLKVLFVVDE